MTRPSRTRSLAAGVTLALCSLASAQRPLPELVADVAPPVRSSHAGFVVGSCVAGDSLIISVGGGSAEGLYRIPIDDLGTTPEFIAPHDLRDGRVLTAVGDGLLYGHYDELSFALIPFVTHGSPASVRRLDHIGWFSAAARLGEHAIVVGQSRHHGPAIWRTDSTFERFELLHAVPGNFAPRASNAMRVLPVGNLPPRCVFGFSDGRDQFVALVSAGPDAVTLIPVPGPGQFQGIGSLPGGLICWVANGIIQVSDGTITGTRTIGNLPAGTVALRPGVVEMDSRVWFVASSPPVSEPGRPVETLWVTDGTAAGTGPVDSPPFELTRPLGEIAGVPHFISTSDDRSTLFRVANGARTATRVRDLEGEFRPLHEQQPAARLAGEPVGRRALTSFADGWRLLDASGPDIRVPGPARRVAPPIGIAVSVGTDVVFVNTTGSSSTELWITDGTLAGTRRVNELVPDVAPSPVSSDPDRFCSDGRRTYFFAETGSGRRVIQSDGTVAGTVVVVGDYADPDRYDNLAVAGGVAYFTTREGELDFLYRIDPASNAASLVTPLTERGQLVPVRDQLLVLPTGNPLGSRRVVLTMAGVDGIRFERDLVRQPSGNHRRAHAPPPLVVECGDHVFIGSERTVITTDGTGLGTTTDTLDLPLGTAAFHDNAVWFSSASPLFGPANLFRYDPVQRAVSLEWNRAALGIEPPRVATSRDHAFVFETSPDQVSASGPAGGVFPIPRPPTRPRFARAGTRVFADLGTLHVIDSQGPVELCPLPLNQWGFEVAHDREVWFVVEGPQSSELWVSDGTVAGTQHVAPVQLGQNSSAFRGTPAAQAGRIWLAARTATHGVEPHVIHLTHAVEDIGAPCGRGRAPRLYASAVSAGSPATFQGDAGGGTVAMVLLSPPPTQAVALDTLCRLHVDPANLVFTAPVPVTGGDFSTTVPLPPGLDLLGAVFHAQAVFGPTDYPLGVDLTQALRILVGP